MFGRGFDQVVVQAGFSPIGGKQADDLIGQLRLPGNPILLREPVQRTGYDFLDVPCQRGMGFGGVQIRFDDAGVGRVKAKKPRLEAGRDEALVESEGEVILVGHWSDAWQVTRGWHWLSHVRTPSSAEGPDDSS